MSNHGRRLRHIGQRHRPKGDELRDAVEAMADPGRAVRALTAFALDLAGTRHRLPVLPQALPTASLAAQPDPAPPAPALRPSGRQWSKTVRPGPHDILTWEEALRIPWIDNTSDE